ncbi:collagen alpha-1(I) chain-like [Monodon monoceros]|uniref:collagen alpha-1(I) chain-like n=1 Tax=Monodon monoceros TaxID=40151 RepID=UPI0010F44D1A|nr:collagen alpha-1(I) chain-like [Monodon monoceros]
MPPDPKGLQGGGPVLWAGLSQGREEGEKRREERGRREERSGGGGRRGSGGRRRRRARRWRRPRRSERGAGEPGAQAAAPRPGRARARALRIACSPGIRTSPAPGGAPADGGRGGGLRATAGALPGTSLLGLERAGGDGGRRTPPRPPGRPARPPATRGAPGYLQLAGSSLRQRGRCCREAGGGRRPSAAAALAWSRAELPRGMSLAPAPSRAGWDSGPGRVPSPTSLRGPLGRAERVSGLPREGAAELKIAAKQGGQEGSSEDAVPSPSTSAGPRRLLLGSLPKQPRESARSGTQTPARWTHAPYEQRPRGRGGEGKREAGVPFHIRRWHTVYLGSEEAARPSPRTRSLPFLGDPRPRGGSEGGRGREPLPHHRRRQRNSASGRPGAAGSCFEYPSKVKQAKEGAGAPGRAPARAESGPWEGVWAAHRVSPESPLPAPGPRRRTLRAFRIPERPAPGPAPFLPASLLALGAAFRLVAPGCGGRGRGRPGITGARAAGGRARGRRECARAARGSAGGRGAEARAGSLPPPIPEKGACPRHPPTRGRKRRFVALGITPVSSRPWAGRGRSQVVEPSLVRRLRPLSDLCGRVREMGARVGVSEPFGSGPRRSSRCPACWARSVLGLRRPDRPGPEAAGRLRTRGLGDGHEADPAKPDERRGASNLPWSPRPLAGPPGPAPPPERVLGPKPAPWGRLQLRQGRRARGCGGGGGGRRAVAFGRERAPAPPAACPPLPSLPWPRRPPHPGQPWPPPPSRRCRWSLHSRVWAGAL